MFDINLNDLYIFFSIGLFFGIILSFIPFSFGMVIHIFKRITNS